MRSEPRDPIAAEGGRLEAIEPVNFVHFTSDGPIYLRATRLANSKVMARHWGKGLEDAKLCQDVADARASLEDSFAKTFPEHACGERCGPTLEQSRF